MFGSRGPPEKMKREKHRGRFTAAVGTKGGNSEREGRKKGGGATCGGFFGGGGSIYWPEMRGTKGERGEVCDA
ncbi:hypothetical protein HAX54_040486 [Datura stramonium]|uniref:Uncharacterized protein n=1 Tax=Datura stramonium TaxID=4076 RepID=A0ABS8VRD3_DATST|nr:hypothetical protein [Datura stramonium]